MLADGTQVIVHQVIVFAGKGIEIAVLTFAAAKGNVDINAEGCFFAAGENGHGNTSEGMGSNGCTGAVDGNDDFPPCVGFFRVGLTVAV
jgi:hypothetical protein